jgi:hypothetical protein
VAAPVSKKRPDSPQKRHSLGGADLEPLSRRALQAAGALSLLLILVVLNSLLNSGDSESPFNPNPVAAAAERTAEVPGMRIDMVMQFRSESTPPVTVTGNGAYNGEDNLAEVTYDGTMSQGKRLKFDAILGESGWYFRYPQLTGRIPEGKEWLKIEGFPGQKDISAPGVASPDESLQMLRGAGTVRRLGQAKIGQVQTTRYRVTQTVAQIVDALHSQGKDELAEVLEQDSAQIVGPVRSEVFIDQEGVVRRMRSVSTTASDGKTVTTMMRMDFSDFGIKPNIVIPDDSRVYDITPQLEEGLDSLGQAS